MHPILVELGTFKLRSYGLFLAAAFIVGTLLARHRAAKVGLDEQLRLDLFLLIPLAALVGARLQFVLESLSSYVSNPYQAVQIWEGGLSQQGGVIMAILAGFFYVKAKGVSFAQAADVLAPSIALGVGIARIGCFLNGCCYGVACDLPWAMSFPGNSWAGIHFPHTPIHPTQLYASLYGFAIFGVLLTFEKRSWGPGYVFGLFLILFGSARFLVDFVRYYDPSFFVLSVTGVSINHYQLISILLFVTGWYFFLLSRSGTERSSALRDRFPVRSF